MVIDEAYREFLDPTLGDPVRELVPRYPNVVVTRTFSKAQGMAGIRAGYAIGHPAVITAIDKTLFPFAVNALAQAAAIAAIDSEAEIAERVRSILSERTRVIAELTERGWRLPDAQANFVYLPIGERTDDVYLGLEQRGVVTRPFSNEGIRVTISTPEENDRFLATLAEVMAPSADQRGERPHRGDETDQAHHDAAAERRLGEILPPWDGGGFTSAITLPTNSAPPSASEQPDDEIVAEEHPCSRCTAPVAAALRRHGSDAAGRVVEPGVRAVEHEPHVPVGPERCLAMITSAAPLSVESRL